MKQTSTTTNNKLPKNVIKRGERYYYRCYSRDLFDARLELDMMLPDLLLIAVRSEVEDIDDGTGRLEVFFDIDDYLREEYEDG